MIRFGGGKERGMRGEVGENKWVGFRNTLFESFLLLEFPLRSGGVESAVFVFGHFFPFFYYLFSFSG